jgi:hypothetical protein
MTEQERASTEDIDLRDIEVRPIRQSEATRWNELMASLHFLGFRCLVGESIKYVAHIGERWVALLGWASAAFKTRPRDQWLGWSIEQREQRRHLVVNNLRFLILPDAHKRNLASRVLSLNLKRLPEDWRVFHVHRVVLSETFVDPARHRGTCYRAAGWLELGETLGFRRSAGRYFHHGKPKTMFVKPIHPDARKLLSASFLPPELSENEAVMIDLNNVNIDSPGGLFDYLGKLTEPRKPRGTRHKLSMVLATAVCACLAGAKSFLAIADWIAVQPPEILARLRCRRKRSEFTPPSEPTIRRVLQSIDAQELDKLVGKWLSESGQLDGVGLAIDGKTLRGSKNGDTKAVHLVAALLHDQGVTIAQQQVDEKSNEITAVEPLFESVDISGKVVTADAMHTQTKLARHLVEEKNADYLFSVKGNQPTLLDEIEALDDSDFFSLTEPAIKVTDESKFANSGRATN